MRTRARASGVKTHTHTRIHAHNNSSCARGRGGGGERKGRCTRRPRRMQRRANRTGVNDVSCGCETSRTRVPLRHAAHIALYVVVPTWPRACVGLCACVRIESRDARDSVKGDPVATRYFFWPTDNQHTKKHNHFIGETMIRHSRAVCKLPHDQIIY